MKINGELVCRHCGSVGEKEWIHCPKEGEEVCHACCEACRYYNPGNVSYGRTPCGYFGNKTENSSGWRGNGGAENMPRLRLD